MSPRHDVQSRGTEGGARGTVSGGVMTAVGDGTGAGFDTRAPRPDAGQDLGWTVASYHAEVGKLSRTLAGLTAEDLARTDAHGRTVPTLLDDLVLIEYTHTTRLAQLHSGAAAQARARYIQQSHRTGPPTPGRSGQGGWTEQVSVSALGLAHAHRLLVSRLLQTALTAEEIRALAARPSDPLPPDHLRAVLEVVIGRLAPDTFTDSGRGPRRVEIGLSGPGGGDWVLGPRERPPTVSISAAAWDFARLAGRRVTPDAMPIRLEGDSELAGRLLAAVPEFGST